MSDSWPIVNSDVMKVLDEREKVWDSYRTDQSNLEQLNKLGNELRNETPAETQEFLTDVKTAPNEVEASLTKMKEELQRISEDEEKILKAQAEIERIKQQRMLTIVFFVVVIIIIAILIVLGITNLFKTIFQTSIITFPSWAYLDWLYPSSLSI